MSRDQDTTEDTNISNPSGDDAPAEDFEDEVDAVFEQALEAAPEDREAIIVAASSRPEIAEEVRQLIRGHEAVPRGFLEGKTPESTESSTPGWDRGQAAQRHIGPYEIIEPLGEGGMGVVYLARQREPVDRTVAIKLIHNGFRDAEAELRFQSERQAMARLSHPNIAALYEAGATDDGHPYFVMEHIQGEPLNRYCDHRRLSIEDRLDLFMAVCAGVQHAHQKGILHRDLKSGNVLVADIQDRPIPKIIDFGIAKALGEEPLTEAHELTKANPIGTPAFMSPEALQRSHDVDTRSDVYSLGIMLYRLLTGGLPHVDTPLPERILSGWVPSLRPSQWLKRADVTFGDKAASQCNLTLPELVKRIRGDLDSIVMKAIREAPEQRYRSVAALTDDLERHRANLPIEARPPSARYRLGKLVRRHRVATVAIVLMVLALVVGMTGATWGLFEARAQARRADAEAKAARQVSDFLTNLFNVSDPGRARGRTITARELLDRGAEQIREELKEQPLVQAKLMRTISSVYTQLSLYHEAITLAEDALAVQEAQPNPNRLEIAETLTLLGEQYQLSSRYDDAESVHRRALDIRKRQQGAKHPEVATSLTYLAEILFVRGDRARAKTMYQEALALRKEALGEHHLKLAESYVHLGWLLLESNDLNEAEHHLRRALKIRHAKLGKDHVSVAIIYEQLAQLELRRGQHQAAFPWADRALQIAKKVLDPGHHDIGNILMTMGKIHRFQGQPKKSAQVFREAISTLRQSVGADHFDVGRAYAELGFTLEQAGEWNDAAEAYQTALQIYQTALGPEHESVGMMLNNLGCVLSDHLQRYAEGEGLLRQSVQLFDKTAPPSLYWRALSRWSLANNLRDQRRYREAEPFFTQALVQLEAAGKMQNTELPDLPQLVNDYAKLLEASGRTTEAKTLRDRLSPK